MKKLSLYVTALFLAFSPVVEAEETLEALSYLEGKWSVTSSFYEEEKWAAPMAPMRATADTVLGGSFIRVNAPVSFPGGVFQFEMTLSFDKFHGVYRAMFLDDLNGYMDVYVGELEGGVLSVSNAETGSSFPDGNGGIVIGRLYIEKSDDGFIVTSFIASQKVGPYSPYMRLLFVKTQ